MSQCFSYSVNIELKMNVRQLRAFNLEEVEEKCRLICDHKLVSGKSLFPGSNGFNQTSLVNLNCDFLSHRI